MKPLPDSPERGRGSRKRSSHGHSQPQPPGGHGLALAMFFLITVLAPLAFGAVDRVVQIGLLVLLTIGVTANAPVSARLPRWANNVLIAAVVILLVKEFAPTRLFGQTDWRTALEGSYGVKFLFTHNPEPGRAIDLLLAGTIGAVWFLWVRTLAGERASRPYLAWTLLISAALTALVSFATKGMDSSAIYGWRYTPGWTGFGPFPNRNHTANFLAMGAVLGCGCVAWAGASRRQVMLVIGAALTGLAIAGLLATHSRGGLVALAAGLVVFFGLVVLKLRSKRAVGYAVAGALVIAAMALTLGSKVLSRFEGITSGEVSASTRLQIWKSAATMWRDAPLFGHGLGTFPQIFPMYQDVALENQVVLHPESSWLQWLTELGVVCVALGILGLLFFALPHMRRAFDARTSFYLRAAGFAAVAVLLAHAVFDVPGHRWGTAGFALAALALACPGRPVARGVLRSRRAALVPISVATFWAMPFVFDAPVWSPMTMARQLDRDQRTTRVRLADLEETLRWFPVTGDVHLAVGTRQAWSQGLANRDWPRHFQVAARLKPASVAVCAQLAKSCQRVSPSLSLHYWQMAVERAGDHRGDILRMAMDDTATFPNAEAAWQGFAEANADLMLIVAAHQKEEVAQQMFARWWELRGKDNTKLSDSEVRDFYGTVVRWGTRQHLEDWIRLHPERVKPDLRKLAALLLQWNDARGAWKLISDSIVEPKYPEKAPVLSETDLEMKWKQDPADVVNAREWAHVLDSKGKKDDALKVLLEVAERIDAPAWFVEKAAYELVARGRVNEAVHLVIRPRS